MSQTSKYISDKLKLVTDNDEYDTMDEAIPKHTKETNTEMEQKTNYATHGDLWQSHNSLRDEQHRHEDRLSRAIESVNTTINSFKTELNQRIDNLDTKFTTKIESLNTNLTAKIESSDAKLTTEIKALDAKLTTEIKALDTKTSEISKKSFGKKDAWIMFLLAAVIILLVFIFLPDKTTTLLLEILHKLPAK